MKWGNNRIQKNQYEDPGEGNLGNGGDAGNGKNNYPDDPNNWSPPEGVSETNTGKITNGNHRQWIDSKGDIVRRWDKSGRIGGKVRGPHWHDTNSPNGLKDHIESSF